MKRVVKYIKSLRPGTYRATPHKAHSISSQTCARLGHNVTVGIGTDWLVPRYLFASDKLSIGQNVLLSTLKAISHHYQKPTILMRVTSTT